MESTPFAEWRKAELTLTRAETLRVRRFDTTDFRNIVPRFTTENRRAMTDEAHGGDRRQFLNTSLVLPIWALAVRDSL
jgi:hypothetical protein